MESKLKISIFNSLRSKRLAQIDVALLQKHHPYHTDLSRYLRNPERYSDEILWALLGVCDADTIVSNRKNHTLLMMEQSTTGLIILMIPILENQVMMNPKVQKQNTRILQIHCSKMEIPKPQKRMMQLPKTMTLTLTVSDKLLVKSFKSLLMRSLLRKKRQKSNLLQIRMIQKYQNRMTLLKKNSTQRRGISAYRMGRSCRPRCPDGDNSL